MSARKYRVYSSELDWVSSAFFQGAFVEAYSAVFRLTECTHERVWVEDEDQNDVTDKLISEAPKDLRVRLARSILEWHVTFGRGAERPSPRYRAQGIAKP